MSRFMKVGVSASLYRSKQENIAQYSLKYFEHLKIQIIVNKKSLENNIKILFKYFASVQMQFTY